MTEADKKLGERLRTLYRDNVSTYGNVHPEFWAILAAEARRLIAAELARRVVPDENQISSDILQTIGKLEDGPYVGPLGFADAMLDLFRPTLATLAAKLEAAEAKASKADALAVGALTSYETAERELEAMTKRTEAAEKRAQEAEAEVKRLYQGANIMRGQYDVWMLYPEDFLSIIDALLNPPEPNEALKAAAERYKRKKEQPHD